MEQETPILLNSRMCLISFTAEQESGVHIIASLCRVTVPDYQAPPELPPNFLNLGLAVLCGRQQGQDPSTQLKGTAMAG